MSALTAIQDKLDSTIADAQSEVGQFLMQKKRILELPNPAPDRAALMQDQKDIEDRAGGVVSAATALKAKFDNLDPLDFDNLRNLPSLLKEGSDVLAQLGQLRSAMQAHIARVNAASSAQPLPSRAPVSKLTLLSPRVLLSFGVVAGLALAGVQRLKAKVK
jgi:hypothetical protein